MEYREGKSNYFCTSPELLELGARRVARRKEAKGRLRNWREIRKERARRETSLFSRMLERA